MTIDQNNEISMHSSMSFPVQTKSPVMFYRFHDLKRLEREQKRLEQQASSSACSSTPLGDDLGTNEFRPTDGVKTSNQKQAVEEVAQRRMSLTISKAQHTTEHPLQKLHVSKKRRKSDKSNESHTEQEESSNHEDRITHRESYVDKDTSKRAACVELTFDEDPIINKILSDLYHDFLSKSSNDGDVSSLSYDDKMLLEAASTGEAFKVLVNDAAEFDILPTAFQSSRWIV